MNENVIPFKPAGGAALREERELKRLLSEAGVPVDEALEILPAAEFDLGTVAANWYEFLYESKIKSLVPDTEKDLYNDRSIVYEASEEQVRLSLIYYFNQLSLYPDMASRRDYYEANPIIGLYLQRVAGVT